MKNLIGTDFVIPEEKRTRIEARALLAETFETVVKRCGGDIDRAWETISRAIRKGWIRKDLTILLGRGPEQKIRRWLIQGRLSLPAVGRRERVRKVQKGKAA